MIESCTVDGVMGRVRLQTFADIEGSSQRVTQIELTMRVLDELRCVEILTNVDEQAILLQCCSVAVRVGMVCG